MHQIVPKQKWELEQYGWWVPANGGALEEELWRELTNLHPLYQKELYLVARAEGNDDALFTDGTNFYLVHLIWSRGDECWPRWKEISTWEEVLHQLEAVED